MSEKDLGLGGEVHIISMILKSALAEREAVFKAPKIAKKSLFGVKEEIDAEGNLVFPETTIPRSLISSFRPMEMFKAIVVHGEVVDQEEERVEIPYPHRTKEGQIERKTIFETSITKAGLLLESCAKASKISPEKLATAIEWEFIVPVVSKDYRLITDREKAQLAFARNLIAILVGNYIPVPFEDFSKEIEMGEESEVKSNEVDAVALKGIEGPRFFNQTERINELANDAIKLQRQLEAAESVWPGINLLNFHILETSKSAEGKLRLDNEVVETFHPYILLCALITGKFVDPREKNEKPAVAVFYPYKNPKDENLQRKTILMSLDQAGELIKICAKHADIPLEDLTPTLELYISAGKKPGYTTADSNSIAGSLLEIFRKKNSS